jgi:hypothetical protein
MILALSVTLMNALLACIEHHVLIAFRFGSL